MARRDLAAVAISVVLGVLVLALIVAPGSRLKTETLPARLSDAEFWRIVSEFSERGGSFRSDNFVSNEATFQYVIPELRQRARRGGVYLGVGPDQNFTYIAALKPKIAFILDIRRQNMLLHLMYKAIFEMSATRTQFLSRLFSIPVDGIEAELPADVPPERLFERLEGAGANFVLAKRNLQEILQQLEQRHGFTLSEKDRETIEYVYMSFVTAGMSIRYSFPNQQMYRRFPTYKDLMLETDGEGANHSYMSSDENYQVLRQMHIENRLVPLVGDFAGNDALRAVGRYLKDHGAPVTAFYTSNVEFYLFQSDDWKRFFYNVANLPMDESSLFIRAVFNNSNWRPRASGSGQPPRSVTHLDNMIGLIDEFERGRIRSYGDMTGRRQ